MKLFSIKRRWIMKQRCVVGSHVRVVVRWCWIGKSLYSVIVSVGMVIK
jgi:hypothetical protein